jgi:hypothetical protein
MALMRWITSNHAAQDAAGAGGAFLLAQAAAVNPDAVSSICASIVSVLVAGTVFVRALLEAFRYLRNAQNPRSSTSADTSDATPKPPAT